MLRYTNIIKQVFRHTKPLYAWDKKHSNCYGDVKSNRVTAHSLTDETGVSSGSLCSVQPAGTHASKGHTKAK